MTGVDSRALPALLAALAEKIDEDRQAYGVSRGDASAAGLASAALVAATLALDHYHRHTGGYFVLPLYADTTPPAT